jgi:hypothetical protein
MSTVHAKATVTTNSRNTVCSSRMKSRPRPRFQCAECKLVNDCDCLSQLRLIDLLAPLVRQLLEHLATDGSVVDDEVCERLTLLIDRNDQREREVNALYHNDDQADRDLIDDVVGPWGYEPSFRRDAEGIAQLRKVPVEHVRGLLDRFLRDSRPEVPSEVACTLPLVETWAAWAREVKAAVERRVA